MLKQFLERLREKKRMQQDMEDEYNVSTKLMQKRKSANERELEKYMEEERQEMILNRLKQYRKKRLDEFYHGNNIMINNKKMLSNGNNKQKNLFAGKACMLKDNKKLF